MYFPFALYKVTERLINKSLNRQNAFNGDGKKHGESKDGILHIFGCFTVVVFSILATLSEDIQIMVLWDFAPCPGLLRWITVIVTVDLGMEPQLMLKSKAAFCCQKSRCGQGLARWGLGKTRRIFFEYYWGLSEIRDDLDRKKTI